MSVAMATLYAVIAVLTALGKRNDVRCALAEKEIKAEPIMGVKLPDGRLADLVVQIDAADLAEVERVRRSIAAVPDVEEAILLGSFTR